MEKTIGEIIAQKRKEKKLTQEELAERMGVSAQAVSKWENGLSCPDITLLPPLAALFGVTVDELLGVERKPETVLVPEGERKRIEDMMLRMYVHTGDGECVKINVPLSLIRVFLSSGLSPESLVIGKGSGAIQGIDFEKIFLMVESGMMGKLLEVECGDGTVVEIFVE